MDNRYLDIDGAVTCHRLVNPYAEQHFLDKVFPDPLPAWEEMMGELPITTRSRNRGPGPTLAEVFEDTWEDAWQRR